jgi:hypothetical protein
MMLMDRANLSFILLLLWNRPWNNWEDRRGFLVLGKVEDEKIIIINFSERQLKINFNKMIK